MLKLPRWHFITSNLEVFQAKRLLTLGGSKAVTLPRMWVELFAPDGWVEVVVVPENGEIILRPLTAEKREVIQSEGHRHYPKRRGTDAHQRPA